MTGGSATCAAAAACFWIVFSAGEIGSQGYRDRWRQANEELIASLEIAEMHSVCGVALYGVPWWHTMYRLQRLYLPNSGDELARDVAGFNLVLYTSSTPWRA